MSHESRTKMVRSAASLIRTRGVNATSFSEVVADSGAPRGSIYHHFPQGKEQLAGDAIQWTSDRVLAHMRTCPATTPSGVLDWFMDMWRQVVIASGGAAGCVVAGVAIDTMPDARSLMALVHTAFQSWVELLARQLEAAGVPQPHSRSVALATLAGMEGALILCRAEQSVRPLETVAAQLRLLLPAEDPPKRIRRAGRPSTR